MALSAEISLHDFSQYRYISTVAFRSNSRSDVTIRSGRWKDAFFQLGVHLSKHSTPSYGVKTADNNFLQRGRDNKTRRGTLPVSGVYLNNFPFKICLTPGSLHAADSHDIHSISESQQFPFIRFCFSTCSLVLVHSQ